MVDNLGTVGDDAWPEFEASWFEHSLTPYPSAYDTRRDETVSLLQFRGKNLASLTNTKDEDESSINRMIILIVLVMLFILYRISVVICEADWDLALGDGTDGQTGQRQTCHLVALMIWSESYISYHTYVCTCFEGDAVMELSEGDYHTSLPR